MTALAVVASVCLGGAQTQAAEPIPPVKQRPLIFYHWWSSPSESAAINALMQLFREKYPDVSVSPILLGGVEIRPLFPIIKKLADKNESPAAFQANAGYAAQVFFDAGLLDPIDSLWAHDKLEAFVPPVVRDMNKFEGHYYSVPINVHRTNVIWYNKPLLDKHKIDPGTLTTWKAFFDAVQALKAAGVRQPLQMGQSWAVTQVFESIMAGLGIDVYEDWINGKIVDADDARLVKAFTVLGGFVTAANPDHAEVTWDAAIHRVMKGEGAFSSMGDWADGEFRVAGLKYGKDYGTLLVPGTAGLYGLNVDTFQHPRGIADPTSSNRWLSLAASREGQDAFSPLKGSIPARTDADPSRYDAYQRSSMADFKAAQYMYPNRPSGSPEAFNNQTNGVFATFMQDLDVKKASAAMAAAARNVKLAGGFKRTWSLRHSGR